MQGRQTGSLLLAAIALIVVIAGLVVSLNFLAVSDNASGGAQAASGQALAAAKAGIEQATRALRSSTQASFALACTVSVPAASAAVGSGTFTLSATRYNPSTTLAVAVANATVTTIQLTSSTGFAPRGTAIIDSERINYTGISGNTLIGVTRGMAGTLAATHATGGAGTVFQDQCQIVSKGTSGNALRQLEATVINGQWSAYLDGASTAVGNGVAATLATLNTTMPAGDNIVIAVVTLNNVTATATTLTGAATGNLALVRNAATVDSNRLTLRVGGGAGSATVRREKTFFFVAKDSGAPANPVYTVTGQGNNANTNAQVKIFVINTPPASFSGTSGAAVAISNAGQTTIASTTATGRAEDEYLVVAAVQIQNGNAGARTIAAGNLRLRRTAPAAATLASNQYVISLGTNGNVTSEYSMLLLALDTAPGVNPTYDVSAQASNTTVTGDGAIVAIRGIGTVFSDGGSVALASSPTLTVLATQATTAGVANSAFPSLATGASNLVIASIQYIQTTNAARTTAVGQEQILYSGTSQTSNTFLSNLCATGTSVNCGHFESALLWSQTIAPATPSFTVQTASSGAGTTAETKVSVLTLDPIGPVLEVYP
jgi:hypothetical protein